MSDLVWSDYFDNDREASTGSYGGNKAMTVYELIQQLQDCDKPDATVVLYIENATGSMEGRSVMDVYYESITANEVVVNAK